MFKFSPKLIFSQCCLNIAKTWFGCDNVAYMLFSSKIGLKEVLLQNEYFSFVLPPRCLNVVLGANEVKTS